MTKVVLIHWNENEYVRLAEKQARKYNDVELILDIFPYKEPESMEIGRWFVLSDYMSRKNLDRVVYIDSDVLLYKNVDEDFRDCDMALSWFHSGHTMFVNNRGVLDSLCLYMQENRDNLELINKTKERFPYNRFADTMGDMVLLNNFTYDFRERYKFGDIRQLRQNSVYDHNFNMDTYLKGADGKVYTCNDSEFVVMNSLHFQGGAKERMKEWITY